MQRENMTSVAVQKSNAVKKSPVPSNLQVFNTEKKGQADPNTVAVATVMRILIRLFYNFGTIYNTNWPKLHLLSLQGCRRLFNFRWITLLNNCFVGWLSVFSFKQCFVQLLPNLIGYELKSLSIILKSPIFGLDAFGYFGSHAVFMLALPAFFTDINRAIRPTNLFCQFVLCAK